MDGFRTAAPAVSRRSATDFDDYVTARAGELLRTAFLLTGDRQIAEHLVQTVLAKVWPRWQKITERAEPHAYVRKVLLTTYLAWWRRRWNGEQPVEVLPESAAPENPRSADRLDLLHALGQLPRGQRAAVVLRYVEDLSEARTAEIMGCSVGTVKSQCSRGLAALRRNPLLAEDGDLS